MKVKLKLARVGMNMQEATIVEWHKQPGERFVEGDSLYAFETEKVTQEVQAPAPGQLLEILVNTGEEANVGDVICVVDVDMSKSA
jgi:pyruvate/2-oxoglutarate dehydrogenase complex dihydrolipoamide acyltransferase (E2) component